MLEMERLLQEGRVWNWNFQSVSHVCVLAFSLCLWEESVRFAIDDRV